MIQNMISAVLYLTYDILWSTISNEQKQLYDHRSSLGWSSGVVVWLSFWPASEAPDLDFDFLSTFPPDLSFFVFDDFLEDLSSESSLPSDPWNKIT